MSDPTSRRYYLRKIGPGRRSLSVYLQVLNQDGSTNNHTIKDPDIDAINALYASGTYSIAQAHTHAEKVRARLNQSIGADSDQYEKKALPQNLSLFKKYWEKEYSHRILADEDSAYGKLNRAVMAMGDISISTGSRSEMANLIKSLPFDTAKKRQITSSLNQLLKFAQRDFTLKLPKKVRPKIKYLTVEEYNQVIANMPDEMVSLCDAAYYTGARQGEVYALFSSKICAGIVNIDSQITRKGEDKDPKWQSIRKAYIFEGAEEAIAIIESMRSASTLPTRYALSKAFSKACKQAFPNRPDKHCCYHDLRHSYAIRLLGHNVSLSLISQALGNCESVCREYYVGYVLTDESIGMIARLVEMNEAK